MVDTELGGRARVPCRRREVYRRQFSTGRRVKRLIRLALFSGHSIVGFVASTSHKVHQVSKLIFVQGWRQLVRFSLRAQLTVIKIVDLNCYHNGSY